MKFYHLLYRTMQPAAIETEVVAAKFGSTVDRHEDPGQELRSTKSGEFQRQSLPFAFRAFSWIPGEGTSFCSSMYVQKYWARALAEHTHWAASFTRPSADVQRKFTTDGVTGETKSRCLLLCYIWHCWAKRSFSIAAKHIDSQYRFLSVSSYSSIPLVAIFIA